MWFLLIFGRNVECAMGHKRFLVFYIGCGLLAGLAHVESDVHSIIPYLGASGAIAGVMGAYVSIYPLNQMKVWFVVVFDMPALLVVGLWVLLQYLSAMIDDNQAGGVAYWAHLGGFFAGFMILRVMVFKLRLEVAASEAAKEQAAAANPGGIDERRSKPPDPYAGFVTMQTIRRMQEQKNRGNPAV